MGMEQYDFVIISQSELVDYNQYSSLPLDRLPLYKKLVFPRMIYYRGAFRSHLDFINMISFGKCWSEANFEERRKLFSIWNLASFVGTNLANYLKKYEINTFVINNFDAEWDIFCRIYEGCSLKPIVGISTTFHLNYHEITRLVKCIKSRFSDALIVLGGAFVNSEVNSGSEQVLTKTMKKYGINFVIHSFNSDIDIRDLLLARKFGGNYKDINNLIYSLDNKENNEFLFTPKVWNAPVVEDIAVNWSDLDFPFIGNIVQIRASSGCSFHCAFCSYPELAKGFHAMPVDIVEKQIRSVLQMKNIKNIVFIDDTFNVPVSRFRKLCQMFTKYDFKWFSFLRVQYVDEEIAKLMKESGCCAVYLGIESADNKVLKNMNKRATREEFTKGIQCLKKYGITIMAAFVIGFPGETEDTLKNTVNFIETMGIDFYTLKEFFYIKNTLVDKQRKVHNLLGDGANWSHSTMDSLLAYEHKISMFKKIKNSVFVDPDTSLWYLVYLYSQGYSMSEIAKIQSDINKAMMIQIDGDFDCTNLVYRRLAKKLDKSISYGG
ncbi:MAG: B12-binding domain-containing radical SAM protein [Coxiellaceae bacterium]|jgi:p-methyltransferase|nr:B12-binding domain-containing radical SAM protein [Coxiellaceae bacterium]